MIRHISLLTWVDGTTGDQVAEIEAQLRDLVARIPAIRRYELGRDLGLATDNASFAVLAEFDDLAGYVEYRDHPGHRRLLESSIAPILASRSALQVEMP